MSGRARHQRRRVPARLVGLGVALVLAALAYIVLISINGVPFQTRHALNVEIPSDAPPLKVGDQVRVGGQRGGIVKKAIPAGGGVEIQIEVTPDFWPVGRDATVRVRTKLASGLAYVELHPGHAKPYLAEG